MHHTTLYRSRPAPLARRHAFTLVELLVVIGIIALLISILMPALTRARKSAQKVQCMSNLRQIGNGILMYAGDWKGGVMPYYNINLGAWYRKLVANPNAFPYNVTNYISTYEVFRCPSDILVATPDPVNFPTDWDWALDRGYISYGMSMGLTLDFKKTGWPEDWAKISQIRKPSETVMALDARLGSTNSGIFYVHPYMIRPHTGEPAIRHGGPSCNVLWVDGHVSSVIIPNEHIPQSIYWEGALTDYSMTNTFWDRK